MMHCMSACCGSRNVPDDMDSGLQLQVQNNPVESPAHMAARRHRLQRKDTYPVHIQTLPLDKKA